MAQLVRCKNCEHGIIVKIVEEKMLDYVKRQQDFNPVRLNIYGNDYSATINCTLCGHPQFIECVDGKIDMTNLKIEEAKDGKENNEEDEQQPEVKPGTGDNNEPEPVQPAGEPQPANNPQPQS